MDDSDLTDDQINQLTQLGIIPGKQDQLAQQLKMAMALRQTPMPGMTYGNRVDTAPSPLASIASGLQQFMGARQIKNLQGQQSDLLNQQAAGRAMMAKLLRGKQSIPPQTLPTGPQDSDPGDM